jgi:chromate reductase
VRQPAGGVVESDGTGVNTKFDANRQCTDETTRKFLTDQMRSFERWIEGVRRLTSP